MVERKGCLVQLGNSDLVLCAYLGGGSAKRTDGVCLAWELPELSKIPVFSVVLKSASGVKFELNGSDERDKLFCRKGKYGVALFDALKFVTALLHVSL